MGRTAACPEPSMEQMLHRHSPTTMSLHLLFPTLQGLW